MGDGRALPAWTDVGVRPYVGGYLIVTSFSTRPSPASYSSQTTVTRITAQSAELCKYKLGQKINLMPPNRERNLRTT